MKAWHRKREVIRSYDGLSNAYDRQYTTEQNAKIRSALSKIKLKEGSVMLDIGCGTGLLFKYITGSGRMIVGLDISKNHLKKAQEIGKQFSNVSLIRADADFIPIQDMAVDAVFAITLLQNMPDPVTSLNEMKRVSKDRSIIIITGLKKWLPRNTFMKLIEKAGLRAYFPETSEKIKGYIAIIDG